MGGLWCGSNLPYLKVTLRNSSLEGPFLGATSSMEGAEGSVWMDEVLLASTLRM